MAGDGTPSTDRQNGALSELMSQGPESDPPGTDVCHRRSPREVSRGISRCPNAFSNKNKQISCSSKNGMVDVNNQAAVFFFWKSNQTNPETQPENHVLFQRILENNQTGLQ